MKDDHLLQEMRRWLQQDHVAMPDAEAAARQVAARLPTTKQRRGRWWRFARRQQAPTPTAGETTDHQPFPIPATIGRRPDITGRTTSMFSPAKAIFAGAVVLGIGSVLLVAQPLDRPGGVPGAETMSAPVAPVEFTGRWEYSYTITAGEGSGGTWAYAAEGMSDPRLDGRVSITGNSSVLVSGATIWSSAFRIENDEGAWQEVPGMLVQFGHAAASTRTGLFEGEGAYEGLVAVTELAWDVSGVDSAFDVRGIVFDADTLPTTVEITR
jgi:hypothetical protein